MLIGATRSWLHFLLQENSPSYNDIYLGREYSMVFARTRSTSCFAVSPFAFTLQGFEPNSTEISANLSLALVCIMLARSVSLFSYRKLKSNEFLFNNSRDSRLPALIA